MKMYKRLFLTYINKYSRLDMEVLSQELSMSEHQVVDMAYSLKEQGYFEVKDGKYLVTPKGKEWVFPMWNDWSRFGQKPEEETETEFCWDYLYIPENML